MSQNLFLLPGLLDQLKDSSTGVFSLIGCYFTADLSTKETVKKTIKSLREAAENSGENVTIFNAFRSGKIEDLFNQNESDLVISASEGFLGDKLIAGVKIVGLLVVCNSSSSLAEGDQKDLQNVDQIQKALFRALISLQTKKSSSNPESLIGIVYDVFLKQTKCIALKQNAETQKLQKVACEISPKQQLDSNAFRFCSYKLQMKLNLKISSSEFGDYDTILEKISQNVQDQLSSDRNVISINDKSIIQPEENISEALKDIQLPLDEFSSTLNINIFQNVSHSDNPKEFIRSEKCAMCVEIVQPLTVVGLLHPMNKEFWSNFLEDLKQDLCDSIYSRISEVFGQTATASISKTVSLPLPARTYFKCSSTSLPLFCTYSDAQTEILTEKLVLESVPFSLVSEVQDERIKFLAESHEVESSSTNKIYIIMCIFVIVLSIVVGVFASMNK